MRYLVRSLILLLALTPLAGYAANTSVTGKIGLLGAGVEVMHYFTPVLSGRVGLNAFSYDFTETDSGIEYDYDLDLSSVSFLLDWHPVESGFYLSTGIFSNQNELNGIAKPMTDYTIGGTTYPAAVVGELNGKIDFDSTVPYLGLGWGSGYGDGGGWSFSFDLGVLFQGTPNVDLTANSPLASDPTFQADLAQEEADLQKDLDQFEQYPVISVGLSYQF